jgi:oxalate---CoA ligase
MIVPCPGPLRDLTTGRLWSGAELAREAARRAGLWSARGVGPGVRVLLLQPSGAPLVADILALWRAGASAVLMDPASPPPALAAAVARTGARLALFRGVTPPAGVESVESPERAEGPELPAAEVSDHQEALVLLTSGTSEGPKAVSHSRAGLIARLGALRRVIPSRELARSLCVLPLHHGHGLLGGLLLPLSTGGEVTLSAPFGFGSGFDLGAAIDECGAVFVTGVPALWRAALRGRPPARGLLRRVHSASSPLDSTLAREASEWAGVPLVNAYGMTETASWVSGSAPGETREGVVGRGWGAEFAIRNEEVWVRTSGLMTGYLGRADLNEAAVREGWYRTGDRGVLEADGALRLLGRLDDAIDRAGFKVQPEEVESVLCRHPAVQDCVVFGLPHETAGREIAAAVALRRAGAVDGPGLEAWCALHLIAAQVPRRWFFVEKVPRTASGKARRREAADLIGFAR